MPLTSKWSQTLNSSPPDSTPTEHENTRVLFLIPIWVINTILTVIVCEVTIPLLGELSRLLVGYNLPSLLNYLSDWIR